MPPGSSITCKAYLQQSVHHSPPKMQLGCNSTEKPKVCGLFFSYALLELILVGAGCLICLRISENPIKCLLTFLGA